MAAPTTARPPPLFAYQSAGLTIYSAIELPELSPLCESGASGPDRPEPYLPNRNPSNRNRPNQIQPDLRITLDEVPDALPNPTHHSPNFQVSGGMVLLNIPGTARFLITNGSSIAVAPAPGAPAHDIRLFLLGTAFGIACHQRRLFPLHASTVLIGDRAVAFVGPSGAGKSTLGAWLAARGYPLFSDDVSVLEPRPHGPPMAQPGSRRIKLWRDALSALGLSSEGLQRDMSRADKFHVTAAHGTAATPAPLDRIYLLQTTDQATPFVGERQAPLTAIATIAANTYRDELIAPLDIRQHHFRACAGIANQVPVYPLHRRRDLGAMDAVTAILEDHWRADGLPVSSVTKTAPVYTPTPVTNT